MSAWFKRIMHERSECTIIKVMEERNSEHLGVLWPALYKRWCVSAVNHPVTSTSHWVIKKTVVKLKIIGSCQEKN